MKLIAIALAVSAVGSAASLNAQTIPARAGTAANTAMITSAGAMRSSARRKGER